MRSEWELLWRLGLALVLSTVIGLEREYRQKSAGLRTCYLDGQGVLRDVLSRVTNAGFAVSDLNFQRHDEDAVVVDVRVTGRGAPTGLAGELGELDGVLVVHAAETDPD
jgi:uncharacterized membrane protein YhiD involved in acid resistance